MTKKEKAISVRGDYGALLKEVKERIRAAQYDGKPKLQLLVAEISWVKNLVIMECCKDDLEREFYIKMTKKYGWTKDVLIHQIENQSYKKTLMGQTNFDKAVPAKIRDQAKLAIKDEYTFDFLELGEEHSERELERAIKGEIEMVRHVDINSLSEDQLVELNHRIIERLR